MNARRSALIAVATVFFASLPVFGHHSFQAEFDEQQPVTISGTVTKVNWRSPHVTLNVDVKEAGKVTAWELELASPNGLMRQGWKVDSLKKGDFVTVSGFKAKANPTLASARKITVGGKAMSLPATN